MTLREQALDRIKARILDARPGDFVSEKALARSLNISRTPVREALYELASQGLVERVPHIGSFVAQLTPRIVREIMEVREALEGRAAGLASGRLAEAEYKALKQGLKLSLKLTDAEQRYRGMEAAGQAVHAAVLRLADNRRITKAIDDLGDQIHRVQAFAIGLPGRMEQSHKEHEAILEAVYSGDPRRAEWAMRDHLEGTKSTLLAQLERDAAAGKGDPGHTGSAGSRMNQ
jgi:DNA-binding GntR family transcriptional regulator